jgi:hypothetical protein
MDAIRTEYEEYLLSFGEIPFLKRLTGHVFFVWGRFFFGKKATYLGTGERVHWCVLIHTFAVAAKAADSSSGPRPAQQWTHEPDHG